MSKRALKKYLQDLDREALTEQILELYDKFGDVKSYYNFVFNPKEDLLLNAAKARILKEYTPRGKRRPKARRSVAQKFIRQFKLLEVHPSILAELMVFNLEVALKFESRYNCPEGFYKSMFKSFQELMNFIKYEGLFPEFSDRVTHIVKTTVQSNWPNSSDFEH